MQERPEHDWWRLWQPRLSHLVHIGASGSRPGQVLRGMRSERADTTVASKLARTRTRQRERRTWNLRARTTRASACKATIVLAAVLFLARPVTASAGASGVGVSNRDFTIGVIVAVVGNMCISFSYQFQKLAHKRNVEKKPYTRLPLWWLGLSLMLGGEVGNFLAYGWAPATVVSPLGAASVVVNALLAHVLLGEKMTTRNMLGVLLAILGSIVISLTAPVSTLPTDTAAADAEGGAASYIYRSLVTWRAFIFLMLVVTAALALANPCAHPRFVSEAFRQQHVWCNCLMCGLLGCITVMGAKGVSTALGQLMQGNFRMFVSTECWLTYSLIVSAIISIVGQVNFLLRCPILVSALCPVRHELCSGQGRCAQVCASVHVFPCLRLVSARCLGPCPWVWEYGNIPKPAHSHIPEPAHPRNLPASYINSIFATGILGLSARRSSR